MTKAELIHEISRCSSMSQEDVSAVVENFMEVIKDALADGLEVTLRGFGSFTAVTTKPRKARDIGRGITIDVPAKTIPKFKPSDEFKDLLNK